MFIDWFRLFTEHTEHISVLQTCSLTPRVGASDALCATKRRNVALPCADNAMDGRYTISSWMNIRAQGSADFSGTCPIRRSVRSSCQASCGSLGAISLSRMLPRRTMFAKPVEPPGPGICPYSFVGGNPRQRGSATSYVPRSLNAESCGG